jgi:hypothetical protein
MGFGKYKGIGASFFMLLTPKILKQSFRVLFYESMPPRTKTPSGKLQVVKLFNGYGNFKSQSCQLFCVKSKTSMESKVAWLLTHWPPITNSLFVAA